MKKVNKFGSAFFLASFCLLSHAHYGQTNDLTKIATTLEKNCVGKPFLGGMYDPPCYKVEKIVISENGEIAISGSEKGCNVTFFIKDATIRYDKDSRIQIYQAAPRINITFYTENAVIVYQALEDFKKIANK